MRTICLVLVVRAEAPALRQCLLSVKAILNYWVISDASAAESTEAIIKECLSGIPGEFHRATWIDSGTNWTAALSLAKGKADYHLLLDPGTTAEIQQEFKHSLHADSYLLRCAGKAECWAERLVSDRHPWRFVGTVRPFLHSDTCSTREKLIDLTLTPEADAESDAPRHRMEIELLKQAIERGANVPRATFHLAQCYRELGNLPVSIEYYEQRATMAGWAEEIWYSIYQIAVLQQRLGISWVLVLNQYLRAYGCRPSRSEPLFQVAKYYRETGQRNLGRLFALAGIDVPYPADDLLFIERGIYDGGMQREYELCGGKRQSPRGNRGASSQDANPAGALK